MFYFKKQMYKDLFPLSSVRFVVNNNPLKPLSDPFRNFFFVLFNGEWQPRRGAVPPSSVDQEEFVLIETNEINLD